MIFNTIASLIYALILDDIQSQIEVGKSNPPKNFNLYFDFSDETAHFYH